MAIQIKHLRRAVDDLKEETFTTALGAIAYGVIKLYVEQQEKEPVNWQERHDYWKKRCLAAEKFIEESPCDTDITTDQIRAHDIWINSH